MGNFCENQCKSVVNSIRNPQSAIRNRMKYHVFFRTRRGGGGISYEVSKAEFIAVFEDYGIEILEEKPGRRRLLAKLAIPEEKIVELAENIGYTEAILRFREEPYSGEKLRSFKTSGRWCVGWMRRGNRKIEQKEVYVQDDEKRINCSPHERGFRIVKEGKLISAKGHKFHRGVSPLDAKFIYNISKINPGSNVLDPFAGFAGLILEARRRKIPIVASDIDLILSPGLSQATGGKCLICDARSLPFRTGYFDTVITEPPFHKKYFDAVIESMAELCRVIKPDGQLTLLVTDVMLPKIIEQLNSLGVKVESKYMLRRGGGMICYVLKAKLN